MKKILGLLLFTTICFGVTQDKVWRIPHGGSLGAWGAINLFSTNSVGTHFPIVSNTNPATANLGIVRGGVNTGVSSTILAGEGFSWVSNATGNGTATWTTPFIDSPVCTCTVDNGSSAICTAIQSFSGGGGSPAGSTSATFQSVNASLSNVNAVIGFICIGQI